VGRIERWKVLEDTYLPDPDFSITTWMQDAFHAERGGDPVDVVIRFDPHQASYMRERRWHETQRIEELPDGGLILRFHTGGVGEVLRWVLQFGSHAEVLEPPALRQMVIEELIAVHKKYYATG